MKEIICAIIMMIIFLKIETAHTVQLELSEQKTPTKQELFEQEHIVMWGVSDKEIKEYKKKGKLEKNSIVCVGSFYRIDIKEMKKPIGKAWIEKYPENYSQYSALARTFIFCMLVFPDGYMEKAFIYLKQDYNKITYLLNFIKKASSLTKLEAEKQIQDHEQNLRIKDISENRKLFEYYKNLLDVLEKKEWLLENNYLNPKLNVNKAVKRLAKEKKFEKLMEIISKRFKQHAPQDLNNILNI